MTQAEINLLAAKIQTPYCDSKEAIIIMSLSNVRDLTALHKKHVLPRYPRRGNKYVYLKSECIECAKAIDKGEIKIK